MILWSVSLIALVVGGGNDAWPSFRNGGASRAEAASLPLHWSPKTGIAWQRELPGYGQSSPVTWRDTVYVTAALGPMKEKCLVLAVAIATGETQWTKEFAACTQKASNYMASRAAPTPVADANGVYAFFEAGNLVGLTGKGDVRWERSLSRDYGEFQNGHGLGSSLAQTEDAVIVLIDHDGPSYLLAVDKAAGKTRWKTDRKPRSSWTSPIVARWNGQEQVVVSSNGFVDGYDTGTGKLLWTVDGVGGNTIPSPAFSGDRIYVGAARSEFAASTTAVASCCLGLRVSGERPGCDVLWRSTEAVSSYASPLPYGDCVYHINGVGVVRCLDVRTGTTHYAERLAGPCWATPVAAGEHVYFFAKNGVTSVLKAGPTFAQVATNALWDLKNPPKPETYQEYRPPQSETPRGGSLERLMEHDTNRDGKLTEQEIPAAMRGFLSRLDGNSDGIADQAEIAAYRERLSRRSSAGGGNRAAGGGSYGDPTVYGVAVADGAFVIRTGTRLYCVRKPAASQDNGEK